MINKYNGYIYDSCSWGITVAWETEGRYGEFEEFFYNDYRGNELDDILYNNRIAYNYEEYLKGKIE